MIALIISNSYIIESAAQNWPELFLGKEKKLEPYIFTRNLLYKAKNELEKKLGLAVDVETIRNHKHVIAYEIGIMNS